MPTTPVRNGKLPPTPRFLLACGTVGPLVFIVVFLIEGATRPSYSTWHQFVSSLSLGPLRG
jgi:hypothetical membrane protein